MSSAQTNFLGQYIGGILNPRLNHADALYKSGRPYLAVNALKSVIWVLYNNNDDEKTQAREWIKKIRSIEYLNGSGHTRAKREYERQRIQNSEAYELYEEIISNLWHTIHDRGFFTMNGDNGKPLLIPSLNNKSGKSEEKRKGLTKTSSRAGEHDKE